MFSFRLEISGTFYPVTPRYPDSVLRIFDVEPNQMFHREKWNIEFTFQRKDYDLVKAQVLETEFFIKAYESTTSADSDFKWSGRFTKIDIAPFDEDNKTIIVKPITNDRYAKVLEGLDKEFDLIKLEPEITSVSAKKQPILQLNVFGSGFISNFLGGTQWETEKNGDFNEAINVKERYFIPGDSTVLDPDVSGSYFVDSSGIEHVREDNAYNITFNSDFGVNKWEIKAQGSSTVLYQASDTSGLPNAGAPFDLPTIKFVSQTTSSECSIYRVRIFMRLLTDVTNISGTPTVAIPSGDTDFGNSNYGYLLGVNEDVISISSEHSTISTKYGKYDSTALNFPLEYFTKPTGEELPIQRSNWTAFSLWMTYNAVITTLQETGGEDIIIEHCYKLPDVLKVILTELDPTITHDELNEYSNFYYGSNSVRGTKRMPLITPKSNLIVAQYDKPASTAKVKLSEILKMLEYTHQVYFDITSDNKFILEQVDYFYHGGQYHTDLVGTDLTLLLEPQTGVNWGYDLNKYSFEKSKIPERIETSWMDKQSLAFEGSSIENISTYATKGNIEDRQIGLFSSDIDFMLANANDISKDGFFLMDAEEKGGYYLPFVDLSLYGYQGATAQNGYMSLAFLHSFYHRYNAATNNIKINDVDVLAISVKRTKIQEVEYPDFSFDPLKLIKTSVGTGKIGRFEQNLQNGTIKGKVKHNIL